METQFFGKDKDVVALPERINRHVSGVPDATSASSMAALPQCDNSRAACSIKSSTGNGEHELATVGKSEGDRVHSLGLEFLELRRDYPVVTCHGKPIRFVSHAGATGKGVESELSEVGA